MAAGAGSGISCCQIFGLDGYNLKVKNRKHHRCLFLTIKKPPQAVVFFQILLVI
jgi:hypothetical protein